MSWKQTKSFKLDLWLVAVTAANQKADPVKVTIGVCSILRTKEKQAIRISADSSDSSDHVIAWDTLDLSAAPSGFN